MGPRLAGGKLGAAETESAVPCRVEVGEGVAGIVVAEVEGLLVRPGASVDLAPVKGHAQKPR
jgi:hypothetical protein